MSDGPLKIWLHRYPDKPATLALKRALGPNAIGLTLEEIDLLVDGIALVKEQIAIQPNSVGSHSSLDVGAVVKIARGDAA